MSDRFVDKDILYGDKPERTSLGGESALHEAALRFANARAILDSSQVGNFGFAFKPPTENPRGDLKAIWDSMNTLQKIGMSPVGWPVTDLAGLAGDVQMYAENPEERNMLNYGLSAMGMLPFVPGVIKNQPPKELQKHLIDAAAKKSKPATIDEFTYPPGDPRNADRVRNFSVVENPSRFGKLKVDKIRALGAKDELNFFDQISRGGDSSDRFLKAAGMWTDNPGGKWLAEEQSRAAKLDKFDGLRHGSVTANIKTEIPVEDAVYLRGMMGEETKFSQKKVDELAKKIQEEGFDPKSPVFINVGYDGRALINEGNHRIRAAKQAGKKTVPVEISYFAGGENAPGLFSKENLSMSIFNAIRK